MLGDVIRRLLGPSSPEPMPAEDERLALAALMVHVARADGDFDASEAARIDAILAERFSLQPADAQILRAEAEEVEAAATDTVPLTRLIKDTVPHEGRIAVIEACWDIVLADEKRTDDENALMRLVVSLLGVSDPDSGMARQRVMARRQG